MPKLVVRVLSFASLALAAQASGLGDSKAYAGPIDSANVVLQSMAAGSATFKFSWKTTSNGPYRLVYGIWVNGVQSSVHVDTTVGSGVTGSATPTIAISSGDEIFAVIIL